MKADYPMGDQMSSLAAPMMHCNTAQFSGAMEVGTHGLGDDTGLDCFTAMSPDLADLELSRMVAVTTSQSLTPDMSSRLDTTRLHCHWDPNSNSKSNLTSLHMFQFSTLKSFRRIFTAEDG